MIRSKKGRGETGARGQRPVRLPERSLAQRADHALVNAACHVHEPAPSPEGDAVTPVASVVIPVFNERETLRELTARLLPVLDEVADGSFEVVFVDDGSSDGSSDLLDGLHAEDERVKVIHLSRNFGHQAALQAGIDVTCGRGVVLMDADLQDRPEDLRSLFARWREGYDVVYAIRRNRQEGPAKRTAYALFYRTLRLIAEVDVAADAGDFSLIDRRILDVLSANDITNFNSCVGTLQPGNVCVLNWKDSFTSFHPHVIVTLKESAKAVRGQCALFDGSSQTVSTPIQ